VYVDFCYTGISDGTQARPFRTVTEGVNAVANCGTVRVANGAYYNEPQGPPYLFTKCVTLETYNGLVLIGPGTAPQSGDPKAMRPAPCPLWNTGLGVNPGEEDHHYFFRRPDGSSGTAVAVEPYLGWNDSVGSSSWISTWEDSHGIAGLYYYTNTFVNCCSDANSVITVQWMADNGVELFIDGVSEQSLPWKAIGNWQTWSSFTVEGLGPGNHVAVFVVTNDATAGILPTGLRVEWTNYCGCNYPPVANAGPDQRVCLSGSRCASVTVSGRDSFDPDNDTLSYVWKEGTVTRATTRDAAILLCDLGQHTLTLTVDDGHGHTASRTVGVTVVNCTVSNIRPHKDNAGMHLTVETQPGSTYALECKDNLTDPTWNSCQIATGNGMDLEFLDPSPQSKSRFYRVRLVSP
jgi:hypothetical protein